MFRPAGGAYTPEWMMQAATDRIFAKIGAYEDRDLHSEQSLCELHLLCYYSDESLQYNTPIDAPGFTFSNLASRVAQLLATDHGAFDRIFLFNPYEKPTTFQVYCRGLNELKTRSS